MNDEIEELSVFMIGLARSLEDKSLDKRVLGINLMAYIKECLDARHGHLTKFDKVDGELLPILVSSLERYEADLTDPSDKMHAVSMQKYLNECIARRAQHQLTQ